ncbi:ferredoxin-type protein NapG, partial [Escherichia coli]
MSRQRDKAPARRRFLRDAARSAAGLAGIAALLGLQQRQS